MRLMLDVYAALLRLQVNLCATIGGLGLFVARYMALL
jgi:hypothetical protein